ncbi:hypothetical protein [Reyranella sp.]|uniref:hypothetical protein n=1 Tax=Reyranella sp. TaxID=1929291 RepID=UPI001223BBD8|nr:hypothetical protein [Reyranella sp.]TAJ84584.1 MAG: hypothetical protein EPO50_18010 [Reyranella sp.]
MGIEVSFRGRHYTDAAAGFEAAAKALTDGWQRVPGALRRELDSHLKAVTAGSGASVEVTGSSLGEIKGRVLVTARRPGRTRIPFVLQARRGRTRLEMLRTLESEGDYFLERALKAILKEMSGG